MYKKRVDRRFFIRGALGSVMALPFLDALHGKAAIAAGNDQIAPRYFIAVRAGNGVAQQAGNEPEKFWPMENGVLTAAGMRQLDGNGDIRATGILADHADKLLIVQGVNYQYPGTGCGHSSGGNQCLTASPPTSAAQVNRSMARHESIDNLIQRTLCPDDPNPMTLASGREASYLDEVLSYDAPLPGENSARLRSALRNPWSAYTDLFGTPGQDNNGELTNYLAVQRKSVNDLMREQLQTILSSNALSQADRNRIDLHQSAIRDLEVRMLDCHLDDARWMEIENAGENELHRDPTNVDEMTEMMMDIAALCFACDIKRAITLQVGNGNDQTVYDSVSSFPFHWISHRIQGDGGLNSAPSIDNAARLHYEIDKIHMGYFKYLLDKLSEYTTNTGPLLDSCVALWTNDLANGVGHSYNNLPIIIAGSGGGYLRQGAHIDATETGNANNGYVSNSQVLNTIANAVGVGEALGQPVTDFGFKGGQGFDAARNGEISGMKT